MKKWNKVIHSFDKISNFTEYNIIRKTWKGMNQTKMEGGIERHLPKTDDWHRWVRRLASSRCRDETKNI